MPTKPTPKTHHPALFLPRYNRFMNKFDLLVILVLIILSTLLVTDLFTHPGRPATYDGPTHITTIAQFYSSLHAGEFPVRWSGGYGNYGQPLPLYAHQLTAYLGALILWLTPNPELAYNVIILVGAISSTLFMYYLLKVWVRPLSAFIGAAFFNVTAYRLLNIYIRGALPEFFTSTWILLNCLAIIGLVRRRRLKLSWLTFVVSLTLLILTHPLIAGLWSGCLICFSVYRFYRKRVFRELLFLSGAILLSLLVAGYYVIPLIFEAKYLIIGHELALAPIFSGIRNILTESWLYFGLTSHPGPRENFIFIGIFETALLILGTLVYIFDRHFPKRRLLGWLVVCSGVIIFLCLPASSLIYRLIPHLSTIQYAWRWFTLLMLIPPVILAIISDKLKSPVLPVIFLIVVFSVRFPQAYGKNYYQVPRQSYFQTVATLHTPNLNTVWMTHWQDYPPKLTQFKIVDGQGQIVKTAMGNLYHAYLTESTTPLRLVDYTFYFPGWRVLVDHEPQTIEFQDPAYRGLITFSVPPGKHLIEVQFINTKIRLFANTVSSLALMGFIGLLVIPAKFYEETLLVDKVPITSGQKRA